MPEKTPTPALTSNVVPFPVKVKGEVSGEEFAGLFETKKRLSFADQLIQDERRRELLGPAGGSPTNEAALLADWLSQLHVRIIKAPSWWTESRNGLDLEDEDVIVAVFKGMKDAINAAKAALKSAADDAKVDLAAEQKN